MSPPVASAAPVEAIEFARGPDCRASQCEGRSFTNVSLRGLLDYESADPDLSGYICRVGIDAVNRRVFLALNLSQGPRV